MNYEEISARIKAARAMADLIHNAMGEDGNQLTNALLGVMYELRAIEFALDAMTEEDGAEDEDLASIHVLTDPKTNEIRAIYTSEPMSILQLYDNPALVKSMNESVNRGELYKIWERPDDDAEQDAGGEGNG